MTKDMIHGELPIIDLDRLVQPVARVKLFDELHNVLPVDGRAADLLHQVADAQKRGEDGDANAAQTGLLFYDVAREIVASVVPSLSAEHRQRLTIEQMTSIIGIASKQVQDVEHAIERAEKNGSEATTSKPTLVSPVPPTTTPSAPSSSASRGTPGGRSSKSRTTRMH